jgi:hypothetical protein
MNKIVLSIIVFTVILLPVYADNTNPTKYEIGKYNFSFEKEETIENKQPIEEKIKEKEVIQENITPISDNLDKQKEIIKQIKAEEKTQSVTKEREIQEPIKTQDLLQNGKQIDDEHTKIKTPVPKTIQDKQNNRIDNPKLPSKTHLPMPKQTDIEKTQESNTNQIKRVNQPTKKPAPKNEKKITSTEVMLEEVPENQDYIEQKRAEEIKNKAEKEIKANVQQDKTDKNKKDKKKLPFSIELHQMQYSGAAVRSL